MHGDVEDMELSDTTQVTGALIAVHVTSLPGSLHVCMFCTLQLVTYILT